MANISYILVGLLAGCLSGFLGIGGGIIIVPALIFLFGLTQHQAQGTSLAMMIPPIGLLAVIKYYTAGNVKLDIALFMCLGFVLGGYAGALGAQYIPENVLRKVFGLFMLLISIKMIVK